MAAALAVLVLHPKSNNPFMRYVSPALKHFIRQGLIGLMVYCLTLPVFAAVAIQMITVAGQQEIMKEPGAQPAGAADADVTIVEYFDYNCPYCKEMAGTLDALLASDHHLKVIYKDWPIFGGVSVYAAKAALAAEWQSKYLIAHDTLMNGPRLATAAQVDAELSHAGVDLNTLKADLAKHGAEINALLTRNDRESHGLSLHGTPAMIVGRQLLPGVVDLDGMKQLVASARAEK